MDEKEAVEKLAMDFRRWGREATLRIQRMTKKQGVIFDQFYDHHGVSGRG